MLRKFEGKPFPQPAVKKLFEFAISDFLGKTEQTTNDFNVNCAQIFFLKNEIIVKLNFIFQLTTKVQFEFKKGNKSLFYQFA
jgi:hypothetical protein